jgi:hypothetical protein
MRLNNIITIFIVLTSIQFAYAKNESNASNEGES